MTATAEKLLLMIIELEEKIQEEKILGKDTLLLEEQVLLLRKNLNEVNEVLNNKGAVLKG